MIAAEAEIPYPIPTKVKGHLVIVNGHVKEVDLELQGALPTPTPVVITRARPAHRLRPEGRGQARAASRPSASSRRTPYDVYKALDYYIPVLRYAR